MKLLKGECNWSTSGTHIIMADGFAEVLTEDAEINFSTEIEARVRPIIESGRVLNGFMPDGSLPPPPPPPPPPPVEHLEPIPPLLETPTPIEQPVLEAPTPIEQPVLEAPTPIEA